ncbi:MAG: O-antigen ligase family protein [Elusimicrobia bacterium]|nr:O-antigen ligase family protein [Elusimicrobiota bacterium]
MSGKKHSINIFGGAVILLFVLPVAYLPLTADNFLIKFVILSTALLLSAIYLIFKEGIYSGKLAVPILVFLLLKVISVMWSPNRYVALDIFWHNFNIIIAGYFIGVNLKGTRRKSIYKYIAYGSFLPILYGLIQIAGHDPVKWSVLFSGRIGSFMGNPVFFSGYLIAVIPILFYFTARYPKKRRAKNYPAVILLAAAVVCLIYTGTRSSFFAFFAQLAVLSYLVRKQFIKKVMLSSVILFLVVVALNKGLRNRIEKAVFFKSTSVSQRIFKWKTAVQMIKAAPLIGHGEGGVKTKFALYQGKVNKHNVRKLKGSSESQIHSEYLQTAAQTGIIGLLFFLYIIFRTFKNIASSSAPEINKYIFAALCGVLIDSIASFPLYIVPSGFIFYLYLGLTDRGRRKTFIKKPAAVLIILVLTIGYIRFSVFKFYSDYLRKKADKLSMAAPRRAAAVYKKANLILPVDGQAEYRRGLLLYNLGDKNEAVKALKNSISIRHYSEVYNNLAIIYYEKGNYKEALNYWQEAVRIGMPDPDMQNKLIDNIEYLKQEITGRNK